MHIDELKFSEAAEAVATTLSSNHKFFHVLIVLI